VGIGTSSPTGWGKSLSLLNTSNDSGITFEGASRKFGIGGGNTDGALRFYDFTSSAERMRINSSGDVAIGTTGGNGRALEVHTSNDFIAKFKSTDGYGGIIIEDSASTNNYNRIAVTGNNMLFDINNATRVWMKDSGNVGFGTETVTAKITLADHTTAAGGIKFRSAASSVSLWSSGSGNLNTDKSFNIGSRLRLVGGQAASDPDINFTGAASGTGFSRAANDITFITAAQERARLTSGGTLLVGTTVGSTYASTSNEGVEIAPDFIGVARSQNTVMYLNRQGDDGTVVDLRKAGFTRGGLSLISNDLCIHSTTSGHSGLRFANGAIHPTDHTGAQSDSAQIDLGGNSYRFNDLYLQGGVKIGGNGAANTLDDYEEGTFTPTLFFGGVISSGATYGNAVGTYTKIGNRVTYSLYLLISNKGTTTGQFMVGGFPFNAHNGGGAYNVACPAIMNLISHTGQISCYQEADLVRFYSTATTGVRSTMNQANVSNNSEIMLSGTYKTTE